MTQAHHQPNDAALCKRWVQEVGVLYLPVRKDVGVPVVFRGGCKRWVSPLFQEVGVLYLLPDAAIRHYDGAAWSLSHAHADLPLAAIWGSGPDDVYAVGLQQSTTTVLHRTTSWTSLPLATSDLQAIWGTAPDNVLLAGKSGFISRFDGVEWRDMTTPTTQTIYGLHGSSATNVLAVGAGGFVWRYTPPPP